MNGLIDEWIYKYSWMDELIDEWYMNELRVSGSGWVDLRLDR